MTIDGFTAGRTGKELNSDLKNQMAMRLAKFLRAAGALPRAALRRCRMHTGDELYRRRMKRVAAHEADPILGHLCEQLHLLQ